MEDWHPPTRDNYLAVFDEFVRWYEGRVGPLGTQVEGSALLEFGYHLLHRPSRRSPSATLAITTVSGYVSSVRSALKRAHIEVGDDRGTLSDMLASQLSKRRRLGEERKFWKLPVMPRVIIQVE